MLRQVYNCRCTDRKIDIPRALRQAKSFIEERNHSGMSGVDLLSGKDMIGRISERCQKRFSSSLNAMAVCRAMSVTEVDIEVINAIKTICGARI
jgi:hypothetical protein